ncbi:hypothetical protein SPI_07444 [Niveomyces insectorum RCEF 264]|uniref:ATP synthase subunit K, mitochondrial n=1 Tax=Niveomyces insectorum RCEF 264 TaxID=1081102 RepID=A0A167PVF9_9HYPO|nr:hypothetical protein SPI_07444 [Niveomyces insectorum RCEF 264]
MVAKYPIAGFQVGSHYLAIATLTTVFGGAYLATRGGKKTTATPPINASSSDEEDFIKKFLESADADEKKKATH